MCSMQLVIDNPRRASLLQHLIALAAVHGIRTQQGYQDLVNITIFCNFELLQAIYSGTFIWYLFTFKGFAIKMAERHLLRATR